MTGRPRRVRKQTHCFFVHNFDDYTLDVDSAEECSDAAVVSDEERGFFR